jgi:uncharacterized damage-inducible protein DinB
MPDLQTALSTHHQAVENLLTAARAIPASRWSQPRISGKWSPGQVVEHVALAYEVNRGVLHGRAAAATAPRLLRPLIRRFALQPVLRRGRFIPGSKSPKAFRPSTSPPAPAVLLDRLQAAVAGFEADAASAGATTIDHPFFGRLPLVDFVLLQEIHTEHHRGQLVSGAV